MQSGFLFIPAETSIHRLHPVVKVLGLLLLFVPAMAFNHPVWVGAVLVVAVVLLLGARGGENLRRLWGFLFLLFVMSTLLWTLFLQGIEQPEVVFVIGPLSIAREAALYGLAMGCRIAALLILGLVFVTTTRPEDFTYALRRLGVPATMSIALTLSFRLLPGFVATVQTVKEAQQARGLQLDRGGLLTRLRRYFSLAAPVFGYALRQADDLSRALEARGLMATSRRTELREFAARWTDVTAMTLIVLMAAVCVWLRLQG
ncbi:MAG: energy-coupling factor transporter transmembrane component T family protein, partial [Armatimonadota bacterium]